MSLFLVHFLATLQNFNLVMLLELAKHSQAAWCPFKHCYVCILCLYFMFIKRSSSLYQCSKSPGTIDLAVRYHLGISLSRTSWENGIYGLDPASQQTPELTLWAIGDRCFAACMEFCLKGQAPSWLPRHHRTPI